MNIIEKQYVSDQHANSMGCLEKSILFRKTGDDLRAEIYLNRAYHYERKAALAMTGSSIQPSRSVLFRSAAQLAIDCTFVGDADELVEIGLQNNPPPEIEQELIEIMGKIRIIKDNK